MNVLPRALRLGRHVTANMGLVHSTPKLQALFFKQVLNGQKLAADSEHVSDNLDILVRHTSYCTHFTLKSSRHLQFSVQTQLSKSYRLELFELQHTKTDL